MSSLRQWKPRALLVDLSCLHVARPDQSVDLTPLTPFTVTDDPCDIYDPPGVWLRYADGTQGACGSRAEAESRSVPA